jgi:plasmid segregation protein ParM
MAIKVLKNPYAIDLGNGFTKRTHNGEVTIEPSVLADAPDFFTSNNTNTELKFHDSNPYCIGSEVIKSELPAISALGDDDVKRYDSIEFKKLLFGFIAKDFKESVVIPHLVTGLPVNHFKAKAEDLKKMIEGKKVVSVNNEEIIIDIETVHVLPQPIGTYMHLANDNKVDPEEDLTLIIDGGHGSLDVTEMKGYTITKRAGAERGAKNAYIDIYNFLVDTYSDMRSITIANIPRLLEKGLNVDGDSIDISEFPGVKAILTRHFEATFNFVRDNRFDLKAYNKVIFTGGMASMHKERIKSKDRKNFVIIEDAQEANVLGYFDYGKAVMEDEKDPAVR